MRRDAYKSDQVQGRKKKSRSQIYNATQKNSQFEKDEIASQNEVEINEVESVKAHDKNILRNIDYSEDL